MITSILPALLGLLYVNAGEWLMHKYILHGLGQKRHSFWAYHLYEHHLVCRKNGMIDPGYQSLNLASWNAQSKELAVLAGIVLLHAPLFLLSPSFTGAVYASLALYYYKHRKAHVDPAWAKRHLRWHYEHHFGGKDSGNWCVTWPWFDYLLGTRVKSKAL